MRNEPFAFLRKTDGVIEKLSKAMEEGFSAVLDEHIENSDKPDKKHVSVEYVCGKWASEKGESSIFRDCNTNRLSFEELVDDSGYLHGWLDRNFRGWQARLAFYDIAEEPWYSTSCGEESEYVGTYTSDCCRRRQSKHRSSFLKTMSGSRQSS